MSLIARLRGRSMAELTDRSRQACSAWLERSFAVRPAVPRGLQRRTAARMRLLPMERRIASASAFLASDAGAADWELLRQQADAAVVGRVQLLGLPMQSVGEPPRWHREIVSGHEAPRAHWSTIPYLDPTVVGDHKIIWELNRHRHFIWLAMAYRVTGSRHYLESLEGQWSSWLTENPAGIGINWASSLEVGYRAIAWIWAERILGPAPQLNVELRAQVLQSLWHHAAHLRRYLSTWFSPNTHLTGEALALAYLDAHLDAPLLAVWGGEARSILRQEVARQLSHDGVYFESSFWYQRYTVDIYAHAVVLMEGAGEAPDRDLLTRVGNAAELLQQALRPDGTLPLVGDDDGGSLLALDARPVTDARPTLVAAAVALGRPDLCPAGAQGVAAWLADAPMSAGQPRGAAGQVAAVGGLAVLRSSWRDDATVLTLDAAQHGGLSGGHGHADALGVDLVWRGVPLCIDAGTGQYVGEWRERFRQESVHNVVTIAGRTMATTRGPFGWSRRANGRIIASGRDRDGLQWVAASHDGYSDGGVAVERLVVVAASGNALIVDRVWSTDDEAVDATVRWVLAHEPGVSENRDALTVQVADGASATIRGSTPWHEERVEVSPCYGQVVEAPAVSASWRSGRGEPFVTVIGDAASQADVRESGAVVQISWEGREIHWRGGAGPGSSPSVTFLSHASGEA